MFYFKLFGYVSFNQIYQESVVLLHIKVISYLLDCKAFTVDTCTFEEEGLLETLKDVVEDEVCQQFCTIIYGSRCKFFIHDRKQNTCKIFDQNLDNFLQTCRKVGGPREPDCKSVTDPCIVSKSLSYC